MDLKEIQELIRFLNKSNVAELRIEQDNFKLTLRTKDFYTESRAPVQQASQAAPPAAQPAVTPAAKEPAPKTESASEANYITIKSPMIGTFYRSAGPDKESFVEVGDSIQSGKVICIIEAMKLFNEIESEVSGKLVKILADNASPVEYDQPLFIIDPKG
jgi:acetyl-CoA carboxylase biotin carboxyl carrier protein